MNNTSENILSAVDILVQNAISKLEYDKTVTAEVWSIVNLDTGEYKVRYSGNIFSAFASDLESLYKVGDSVYVTIPEGNFSNKKIINSKVSSLSLSYGLMVSLTNSIVEISPTLDNMYEYAAGAETGVVAGAPEGDVRSYAYIYQGSEDGYHGLFLQYSKEYELIRIKASFLTTFHCEHTKGNYGIEVLFFTKSGDLVAYRLDLSSFNGDPYSLSVYSPQYVVIKAQKGYLTGLSSIKLFEEGFEYDKYVESGLVTDRLNTTVANIFVKDVAILFVEQRDLTDNLYYLDISMPQGNSFTNAITSLDLVGRLVYEGENVMSESSCECRWYKRDLSIMLGSEEYDKFAGAGWSRVETSVYDTLTLSPQDVRHQMQYKLVVVYNETVTLSAEARVSNLNSPYDLELRQTTVGDQILLLIIENNQNEVLLGDWYLSYPDGSYSLLAQRENLVDVTDILLYSAVNFYCGVYNTAGTEIIANLEHTITSSESGDDVTITYDGEDTFRYDANGDVSIEDAEKERTLLVVLTWRDGVGTSYRVEWIGPDGQNITNTRYTPTQSMIENLWVDNNNILHYTIKLKYKVNYNNNTIIVKIITIDGQEYSFPKEILFLKDGDQGTNGTTYITAVRPFDLATGRKLSGLLPLVYRNGWQNTLPLRCYVYKDGELINDNSKYTLTYKWTGVNVTLTAGTAEDRMIASGNNTIITSQTPPYAKVLVTVNDLMNGRTYDIYCFYPIDVAVGFTNAELTLVGIDGIPSYIKYTSSGVNPSFYSSNIEFTYGETDYSRNITSLTPTILEVEEDDGLYYLEPASSFVFENNTIAMLRCQYASTKYLLHPIVMYLDTYGNEAINGWDGTKVDVNEEGGYILAPQIGAGRKDSANRFTGVVMGVDSQQSKTGLYGYLSGVNTFGLMEDGTAFFGAKSGGGLIVINGKTATISGGDGGSSASGMTITLADLKTSGTTEAIKIGGGIFKVLYNGAVTATSADITGAIYASSGRIGGTKSDNNGWTITTNRLYSGSGTTRVELNSDSTETYAIWAGANSSATAANSKFAVSKTGYVYAKLGNIGGWTLTSTRLASDNNKIGMASSGTYRFWSGADTNTDSTATPTFTGGTYFWVNSSGEMNCKNATIRGTIYSEKGLIGGWTIGSNYLKSNTNDTILYADGEINCNYLYSDGGQIGGWTISSRYLKGGSTYLYSDGRIVCSDATIRGDITADTLTCYAGTIGSWSINDSGLYSGYTKLTPTLLSTLLVDIYDAIRGSRLGYLGFVSGADDDGLTRNIGIVTETSGQSIILDSARNIAFRGRLIFCSVPASGLHGIYARFA